ncbi:hypothetical protein [Euzebya pacifica]|jgi:hypothetical protein|uniref:hypothetical protein n=1 Tax=Euzebya pacifica TaxID=1608957 RepID=UPI0030F5947A
MSTPPPGKRRLRDVVDEHPFQGGLTGILLVALATLAMAVVAAGLVGLMLLIAG